jgi:predicted ATP-grasp superfamily ATP-dependent carboligase
VLACNRQIIIEGEGGRLHFGGSEVNGLAHLREDLQDLADGIVQAIPGLGAYVGVDLILTDTGPVVVEVNPRLTTSYVGLAQVLGLNPARLVLDQSASREPVLT